MTKILIVQTTIGKMIKDQNGYSDRYKYFDINQVLEHLQPLLIENRLVVIQPLTQIDGKPGIKTIVSDIETGQTLEETITFEHNNDPQKVGSSITYYRRYALQSLFALQAEDDDGHKVSGKNGKDKESNKPRFNDPQFAKLRDLKDNYSPETVINEIEKKYRIAAEMKQKVLALYDNQHG